MPDITLVTSDGARFEFACAAPSNVLDAAEAAGFYLPATCREGTCGACNAHVRTGRYELHLAAGVVPANDSVLGVPLCRCLPQADLTIDAPYSGADVHRHKVPAREAEITGLEPAGSGAMVVSLTLLPDAEQGCAADFVPGQYMELALPATPIRRAYSMANLPNWEGRLEFLVRLHPGGAFSTYLGERARVGDRLFTRGPLGRFILDETSPRARCLIGGGCGFAPLLSMLRHLAEFQDTQLTTLIFAVNHEQELFAAAQIAQLQSLLPELTVTLCVWHPEGAWSGFTGTAAEAFSALLAEASESPDVYVCGPPKLIASVQCVAQEHGLPSSQVHMEQVQAA